MMPTAAHQEHHELVEELDKACEADDIECIGRLLTTTSLDGKDATRAFDDQHTVSVLRRLFEHGPDANSVVLHSRELSLDHLKACAEFGFDFKSKGHLILQDYAYSQEILDWILDQGADVNDSNHNRHDVRRFGGGRKDFSVKVLNNVAARGDIELFDHLVRRGADPHRSLALHSVSRCQDSQKARAMVDHLLDQHGMNIEANSGVLRKVCFMHEIGTPVHCAVHYKNLDVLDQLLVRGADPNSGVKYATGGLWHTSYLPALVPLLDAGADVDRALDLAIRVQHVEAVKICLDHGADVLKVMKDQRARAVRVKMRREAVMNDAWSDDAFDEDSHSSEDDVRRAERRTEIRDLLQSSGGTRQHTGMELVQGELVGDGTHGDKFWSRRAWKI